MLHGEPVLGQPPPRVKAVPWIYVVLRSCFAQDIGSYKAYAVCTCNLTLASRIYRHTDVAVPPSARKTEEAVAKQPLCAT